MFRLLRHFSVMSAIATAAITTILMIAFSSNEYRNLNQLAADRNTAQAYNFANSIWPKYSTFINQSVNKAKDEILQMPELSALNADVLQLTRGLPVLKVKIYGMNGWTVFSSDPNQISESKATDPGFRKVADTGMTVTKSGLRNVLNSFKEDFKNRHVAESYVPIRDDQGKYTAIIELYSDITPYAQEIDRNIWIIAGLLTAALAALYIFLLLVVRRADSILNKQYLELETFNSNLEDKVQDRTRKLLDQQRVLSRIIKSDDFRNGKLHAAFGALTAASAAALGVARVSIWIFSPDRGALACSDLFEATSARHSSGLTLEVAKFPAYFSALADQEDLAIDDAIADPRTNAFESSYLRPLGITSMLDAPIMYAGQVCGVVCCEHVGPPVKWTAEQRLFAIAIANLAALVMERHERQRAEEDLKVANRSVEAANRAKSMFLANMSHEIRTPMNGIFGMTDLLKRTELNDRQHKFVNTISQSAKSLLTIINDILDLSRIEAGKFELDSHEFSLKTCVEETVDLLAGEAQRQGLELSVYTARDIPVAVMGDQGRFRQVLTNLVSNAIKFTKAGEVAVSLKCKESIGDAVVVEVQVRDTGIGISPEIQQRLFQPFQQADTSISRRFGGTGLGLSISRHLVELMGGTIELQSTVGSGTCITFTATLPLTTSSSNAQPEQSGQTGLNGKRILILDDRDTNREVIVTYFKECGAETTPICDAGRALAELERAAVTGTPYHLAVVDMLMPGVNGLEFAQHIRTKPALSNLQLMMVTSLNWKGDIRIARELGFGAFLTKPVHRNELLVTASRLVAEQATQTPTDKTIVSKTREQVTLDLNVLVAEDNPVNLEVAREYLSGFGCQVTSAENGRLAVDAIMDGTFDVILMDCQMPEMDGLTATRVIRQLEAQYKRKPTIIIAVTANAFAEDRAACLAAGMNDYVSKPFSEDQLRQLLARWAAPPTKVNAKANAKAKSKATRKPRTASIKDTTMLEPQPIATAAPATTGTLDMTVLGRMQKTHPSLLLRLIDTYLGYAPKAIAQLEAALAQAKPDMLRATAHSLKSSSANVGATTLSTQCKELEFRHKTEQAWDEPGNTSAVAAVVAEFARVSDALQTLQCEMRAAAPAPSSAKTA